MSSWKRDAASGLIIVVPILICTYVVAWLYWNLAGIPVLQDLSRPERVAVLLVLFVVVVLGIGYLMRTALGDIVERFIDDIANRVPLIRVIYNASKMAVETALSGTDELQRPVKLEPWDGMRMTAFKTGKSTEDGRDVLFMPTAPNITTGFVIEVSPDEYEATDERVEDALTRILSAGFGENNETTVPLDVSDGPSEDGEKPTVTDD